MRIKWAKWHYKATYYNKKAMSCLLRIASFGPDIHPKLSFPSLHGSLHQSVAHCTQSHISPSPIFSSRLLTKYEQIVVDDEMCTFHCPRYVPSVFPNFSFHLEPQELLTCNWGILMSLGAVSSSRICTANTKNFPGGQWNNGH